MKGEGKLWREKGEKTVKKYREAKARVIKRRIRMEMLYE